MGCGASANAIPQRHCVHCKGGSGACCCVSGCRRPPGAKCGGARGSSGSSGDAAVEQVVAALAEAVEEHAKKQKVLSEIKDHLPMRCCACRHMCSNRAESYAHTLTTGHNSFVSVLDESETDHCDHCRGLDGLCGCKEGCARPAHVKCKPRHCRHCKGLDGPCGCDEGCERPDGVKCHPNVVLQLLKVLGEANP